MQTRFCWKWSWNKAQAQTSDTKFILVASFTFQQSAVWLQWKECSSVKEHPSVGGSEFNPLWQQTPCPAEVLSGNSLNLYQLSCLLLYSWSSPGTPWWRGATLINKIKTRTPKTAADAAKVIIVMGALSKLYMAFNFYFSFSLVLLSSEFLPVFVLQLWFSCFWKRWCIFFFIQYKHRLCRIGILYTFAMCFVLYKE